MCVEAAQRRVWVMWLSFLLNEWDERAKRRDACDAVLAFCAVQMVGAENETARTSYRAFECGLIGVDDYDAYPLKRMCAGA